MLFKSQNNGKLWVRLKNTMVGGLTYSVRNMYEFQNNCNNSSRNTLN